MGKATYKIRFVDDARPWFKIVVSSELDLTKSIDPLVDADAHARYLSDVLDMAEHIQYTVDGWVNPFYVNGQQYYKDGE